MKTLSVCIPNYNRIEELKRLVHETAKQITEYALVEKVQICISDDCSAQNPDGVVKMIRDEYPHVEILYERSKENKGMDHNFLHSVIMASGRYCWIIGNDDMPTADGMRIVMETLEMRADADIILTPFDIYGADGKARGTVYPLKGNKERLFDTSVPGQYSELVFSVRHNSGLFGFLSNVVFRRSRWLEYRERFSNKLDTIFIQMYMNIQALQDGAEYLYMPDKIIKNYADDETNESVERICRILFGLDGVVEYFFEGLEKKHLKRVMVDAYISGEVWKLPDETLYKKKVKEVVSPKNQIYKKYFIPIIEREQYFTGKKFIIYGTGKYGRAAYKELKEYGADLIGAADSVDSKKGKNFEGFNIMSVAEMSELYRKQNAHVLAANHWDLEKMVDALLKNGIERIGIIT